MPSGYTALYRDDGIEHAIADGKAHVNTLKQPILLGL
tara:strand:+ start:301 stop:411 length:111 start_codon:yes stop_codon:yes gene_type:complete